MAEMEALRAAPFILWEEGPWPQDCSMTGDTRGWGRGLGMPPKLPPTWEGAEQALGPTNCSLWGNPKVGVGQNRAIPNSLCCLPRTVLSRPQTLACSTHGRKTASNKPLIYVSSSAPSPSLQSPHPHHLTGEFAHRLF